MSVYADTSFLVSLYTPDANSALAAERMRQSSIPVYLSRLGEMELTNALQLRLFRREIRSPQARASSAAFRADVREGVLWIRPLPDTVWMHAVRLALKWTAKLGTRTLDIIHVAAALALDADTFQTFNDRQRTLAKAAGLLVS